MLLGIVPVVAFSEMQIPRCLLSVYLLRLHKLSGYISFSFQVFTSIALFNILISPLNAFPWVINGLMEAWVSLKRIESFLTLHELSAEDYYSRLFGGKY